LGARESATSRISSIRRQRSAPISDLMADTSRHVLQLAQQEESRLKPIALHGANRDAQERGDVLVREPAEEAQLDDLTEPRIQPVEPRQRVVDHDDLVELCLERTVGYGNREADMIGAPLDGEVAS